MERTVLLYVGASPKYDTHLLLPPDMEVKLGKFGKPAAEEVDEMMEAKKGTVITCASPHFFPHGVRGRPGSQVEVYDGVSEAGTLLWSCDECQMIVPPILVSESGSFYMQYYSSSTTESYIDADGNTAHYMGFEAKFYTQWSGGQGMGDREVTLSMGSALSVVPPTYNGIYPAGLDHRWVIKTGEAVSGTTAYLTFNELDFPSNNVNDISLGSDHNTSDCLIVYQGDVSPDSYEDATVLGHFIGLELPTDWIQFSASEGLTLRMVTSEHGQQTASGTGFDVAFYTDSDKYQCGHTLNPGVLRAPSFWLSDGSSSATAMYSGMDCQWLIEPGVGAEVESINIAFQRLSLAGGELHIYSGTDATGEVVWSCAGATCDAIPALITVEAPATFLHLILELPH